MKFLDREVAVQKDVFDCLIVGTGAAGYNAAVHLHDRGTRNFAIVTEDRLAGTSRNTGSDKQTYYKVACAGTGKDSPRAMAETLFAGASMDGDLALCEASHSLEEFFHLVSIGVDFPHNRYGEFAGYKTDHDPLQRASSIGPYTSKIMTERLEDAVLARGVPIIDKTRVIKILTDKKNNRAYGLLCLVNGGDFRVIFSRNIIFASGGPAGLYGTTVYPESQFGASAILAREGVVFSNITEWQYGMGSTKFRWNLSGSYQQAIPRYLSRGEEGVEEEFLSAYFPSAQSLGRAVFLKGYEWPFDPAKTSGGGSSTIDLAVYIERNLKGRRVFLDYTQNPSGFALGDIDETAGGYLAKSGALYPTPLERLLRLNPLSYDLYKTHGIDLAKDYLEIDVLPQHHNGGAEVNIWWETSVRHLFAIGECAGTHGVRRPGGSALNSGQVGGLRAASFIAGRYLKEDSFYDIKDLETAAGAALGEFERDCAGAFTPRNGQGSAAALLRELQNMNSRAAMFIRSREELEKCSRVLDDFAKKKPGLDTDSAADLSSFFRFREALLFSRLLYDSILCYIKNGGKSRGSCLIAASLESMESLFSGVEIDATHGDKVLNTVYICDGDKVVSSFRPVRPIPDSDTWFEKVWREYRDGEIFRE